MGLSWLNAHVWINDRTYPMALFATRNALFHGIYVNGKIPFRFQKYFCLSFTACLCLCVGLLRRNKSKCAKYGTRLNELSVNSVFLIVQVSSRIEAIDVSCVWDWPSDVSKIEDKNAPYRCVKSYERLLRRSIRSHQRLISVF